MTPLILTALLLAATPALAFDSTKLDQGGSLPLSDMKALIDQAPKLRQEVDRMLTEKHKTMDEITCGGMRFSNAWKELGGARAAPYDCDFKGKWLHVEARVRLFARNGHEYKTISRAAMRNTVRFTETHPTWQWSDKAPWDK